MLIKLKQTELNGLKSTQQFSKAGAAFKLHISTERRPKYCVAASLLACELMVSWTRNSHEMFIITTNTAYLVSYIWLQKGVFGEVDRS